MPKQHRSRTRPSRANTPYTKPNPTPMRQLISNLDHLSLGDNTVASRQDQYETRISNRVPSAIPKSISHQHYWYKGSYTASQIVTSTSVPVATSYSFNVNSLAESTSLSGVFDQYCIVAATVRILAQDNQAVSSANRPGTLISVIDHDDSAGLITPLQAQEYSSKLETPGTVGQTRVIQPRLATAVYGGSVFTSFGNTRMWVDAGNLAVPWYGCKVLANVSAGQSYTYDVVIELVTCWRDSH